MFHPKTDSQSRPRKPGNSCCLQITRGRKTVNKRSTPTTTTCSIYVTDKGRRWSLLSVYLFDSGNSFMCHDTTVYLLTGRNKTHYSLPNEGYVLP